MISDMFFCDDSNISCIKDVHVSVDLLTVTLHIFCKHHLVLCSNDRSVSLSGKHPGVRMVSS